MTENQLVLGPYTEEIRRDYINYRRARYLIDHPGKTIGQASRAANIAWRRKVQHALARRKAVMTVEISTDASCDYCPKAMKHAGTYPGVRVYRACDDHYGRAERDLTKAIAILERQS